MEKTKGMFTHRDIQEIIDKRGMDVSKLPTQEEIEKRFYERSMAALNRKKARAIYRYSVFPETFRPSLRSKNGSLNYKLISKALGILGIVHTS